jgi:glycine cleavage system H protein
VKKIIKYTETYEYINVDGDIGTVGIAEEASDKLGDIYYVELPKKGKKFNKGDEAAVVESAKSAADVYCPVGGEVVEINSKLESSPELVSKNPLTDGWLFKIKITDISELESLMDYKEFKKFVHEEG